VLEAGSDSGFDERRIISSTYIRTATFRRLTRLFLRLPSFGWTEADSMGPLPVCHFFTLYPWSGTGHHLRWCNHHQQQQQQLYSPLWASASLRIFFHDSLSLATVHQFLIFSFLTSSSTPSFHRSLGRPTLRRPSGLHSIILLGISLSLILWRCPAHRSLVILINLVIIGVLYSWYSAWLSDAIMVQDIPNKDYFGADFSVYPSFCIKILMSELSKAFA
jgi:hypothetical protein